MGLLDSLFGVNAQDPRSQAMAALSSGLLAGNFGQGLKGASDVFAQAPVNALRMKLLQSQVAENESQAEQRKQALLLAKQKQDLLSSVFGPQGFSAPQVSPGAFTPSAGGMGPTMPPQMAGQSLPGSRLSNLGFDQLAALKANGVDLVDLHKYANDPLKLEQGSTYRDRVTGQERFMPKVGEGIARDPNGFYSELPGYGSAQAGIEGKKAAAVEGAKAGLDAIKVYNPVTQREEYRPRSQVIGNTIPPDVQQQRDRESLPIIDQDVQQAKMALAEATRKMAPKAQLDGLRDAVAAAEREYSRRSQQAGGVAAGPSAAEVVTGEFNKGLAGKQATQVDEAYTKAAAAKSALPALWTAQDLLKNGTFTGLGSDAKLNIVRAVSALGIPVPDSVANSQAFDAQLAQIVGANLKSIVGSTNISNADVQFVTKMFGQRGQEAQAIKFLLDKAVENNFRNINSYNGMLPGIEAQGGRSMLGQVQLPEKPKQDEAAGKLVNDLPKNAKVGARIRDTQTGQILKWNGLAWQPEK